MRDGHRQRPRCFPLSLAGHGPRFDRGLLAVLRFRQRPRCQRVRRATPLDQHLPQRILCGQHPAFRALQCVRHQGADIGGILNVPARLADLGKPGRCAARGLLDKLAAPALGIRDHGINVGEPCARIGQALSRGRERGLGPFRLFPIPASVEFEQQAPRRSY